MGKSCTIVTILIYSDEGKQVNFVGLEGVKGGQEGNDILARCGDLNRLSTTLIMTNLLLEPNIVN